MALACKGPLNARLATGVGLSFFLSEGERRLRASGCQTRPARAVLHTVHTVYTRVRGSCDSKGR